MKQITFEVTLVFSGKIESDEERTEIRENILSALVHEAGTKGLSPEDGDVFTIRIKVNDTLLGESSSEDLI